MDVLNVRSEYLRALHYFYFFIAAISFTFALLSLNLLVIFGFLFAAGILNLFIAWVAFRSVERFYVSDEGSPVVNYTLLLFIAMFLVFAPLYAGFISFDTMQQMVIVVSYFLFFFAFGNYMFTRIGVVRDIFRIVHLTKYHFGVSKLVEIFANPRYESLVDVLNLIEPRLVTFYEPGSDKVIDGLILDIANEGNVMRLRRMIIALGIALYDYELAELSREQDDGKADNSVLIRRFGYKKKLLEIINV
ncbi:MAG: hypothetical protein ABIG84_03530 [archaeon]